MHSYLFYDAVSLAGFSICLGSCCYTSCFLYYLYSSYIQDVMWYEVKCERVSVLCIKISNMYQLSLICACTCGCVYMLTCGIKASSAVLVSRTVLDLEDFRRAQEQNLLGLALRSGLSLEWYGFKYGRSQNCYNGSEVLNCQNWYSLLLFTFKNSLSN